MSEGGRKGGIQRCSVSIIKPNILMFQNLNIAKMKGLAVRVTSVIRLPTDA